MDVIWILLIVNISLYNIILSSGFVIDTVIFLVHRRNHGTRKCAMKILNNQIAVGGQISDITETCEQLTEPFDEQKTFEPGYGYVEKIYFTKSFQPAKDLRTSSTSYKTHNLDFPGVIVPGSKLELYYIRTPLVEYEFWIEDVQTFNQLMTIQIYERFPKITVIIGPSARTDIPFPWETMCPLSECKISVLVLDGKIKLLANDHEIPESTVETGMINLRQMNRLAISEAFKSDVQFARFAIEITK